MVIMGVDPGSRVTGYGLITVDGNRFTCLDHGGIVAAGGSQTPALSTRLRTIFESIDGLLNRFSPDIVAVEGVFHAVNVKSALTLGHVRGVIFLAAAQKGIPLQEYSPLEVKKAVAGYGRADKTQVQQMVKILLNLSTIPEPHDASDALAIALCHAFSGSNRTHKQRRWRSYEVPAGKT